MPEGDTLYRTAEVLRRVLEGETVRAARARAGGAQLERVIGSTVAAVRTQGKHLLIDFDVGLTLHTHLQMHGSWHRYRPGERWRIDPVDAVAVLETDRAVAVCFEAPTVELLDTRALRLHPVLSTLGPDLLDPALDPVAAAERLRSTRQPTIAEALLDQRVMAGVGNVYRSEVLAHCSIDPFMSPGDVPTDQALRLVRTASRLLQANVDGGERRTVAGARAGERWVYRLAGRPCRRCGSVIRSMSLGQPPRRLYWCPGCQASRQEAASPISAKQPRSGR